MAKVSRTSWSLDAKSRTLRIELDYPNTTKGNILRPGMFANVMFTIDFEDRFMLPNSAIFTVDGQPCCYRRRERQGAAHAAQAWRSRRPVSSRWCRSKRADPAKADAPPLWQTFTGQENIVWDPYGRRDRGERTTGRKIASELQRVHS